MADSTERRCVNCNCTFEKKGKGYARRSLESVFNTEQKSAINILEHDLNVEVDTPIRTGFICTKCRGLLQQVSRGQHLASTARESLVAGEGPLSKRIRSTQTPQVTPRKPKKLRVFSPYKKGTVSGSPAHIPGRQQGAISQHRTRVISYLKRRQYKAALVCLFKMRSVTKVFGAILADLVREEFHCLLRKKSWLQQEPSLENLESFSWNSAVQEIKKSCPLLFSSLSGCLSTKKTYKVNTYTRGRKELSVAPVIGSITAQLAYVKKPQSAKFFQQMNSIQMWLAGCKRELFNQFYHLNWNVGIKATRSCIDKIVTNYDQKAKEWVQYHEAFIESTTQDTDCCDSKMDDTLPYAEGEPVPMDWVQHESDLEGSVWNQEDSVSIGVCHSTPIHGEVSTVEISHEKDTTYSTAFHSVEHEEEKGLGFTLCFDNVNQKIGVRHYKKGKSPKMLNMVQLYAARDRIPCLHLDDTLPSHKDIEDIPLATILPSIREEDMLFSEMKTLVTRILCENLPLFENQDVRDSVNWHIRHQFEEQSSKKSEMVPLGVLDKDETKTAEMVDVLRNYSQYIPKDSQGNPSTTILYGDGLSCERALDAKGAVINCDDKWERLEGIEPSIQEWHKRVILLQDAFDDLYNAKSAKEKGTLYHLKQAFGHKKVSSDVKANFNHCSEFFNFVTEGYIVLAAMHVLGISTMDEKPSPCPETSEDLFELLQKTSEDVVSLIFVNQNINSVIQARITQKDIDASEFCICKTEKDKEIMIYCDNRQCPNGGWFHLSCIDMEERDIPEGEWFCSQTCEKKEKPKKKKKRVISNALMDRKREYVRGLIWHGLNNMVRRDAIRENDGDRIISHWKLDLMPFFNNNHPKYLILAIILACQQSGAASARTKHQLKWNRTVNAYGGIGRNLEMDLQMEFFNRDYKESVKASVGQMTDATVSRHSLMIGVRKNLTKAYALQVVRMPLTSRKTGTVDWKKDIRHMVHMLQPELLFEKHLGREFHVFEDFIHTVSVVHPKKMKARIVKHQQKFAKRRELIQNLE